eukprot:GEMP01005724.1.p1 GENE.GEMP01005724.1~~GEMP01005724.1.p1  ORF type:complete len:558 (+),score=107.75 GEMP01005724.1:52-1725(+)
MTDVRVRYLSGDVVTVPNINTIRHLQVAIASLLQHFAPDILLFNEDNGCIAGDSDTSRVHLDAPPQNVIAICRNMTHSDNDDKAWARIMYTHAAASDESGILRALNVLASRAQGERDLICTTSFMTLLFDEYRTDTVGLELLLRNSADVNNDTILPRDHTPLFSACRLGNRDIVSELIHACKADVNKPTVHTRVRPLTDACTRGFADIAQMLICANAEVNMKDVFGVTPLHAAATYGHDEICAILLEANAPVDCEDGRRRTALACASAAGHTKIVEILMSQKADIKRRCSFTDATPLLDAVSHGHIEIVRLFLNTEPINDLINVPDSYHSTPLQVAAATGNCDIVSLLLSAKSDINMRDRSNRTALYRAAWNGHADIARVLFHARADVQLTDNFQWTPLHAAATNGHADVLIELLSSSVKSVALSRVGKVDENNCTALYLAAKAGHAQCVRVLLNADADIHVTDNVRCTALYRAAWNGHTDCVNVLLAHGAKVNVCCSTTGSTPLHGAAWRGHSAVVRTLLQYGANTRAMDYNGATPWNEAEGHTIVVDMLLDAEKK